MQMATLDSTRSGPQRSDPKARDAVQRTHLADEVATTLRRRILDGELEEGSRLNEVHLAEQVGVSRTPLREALGRLASEQMVEQIPHRGFFVRRLCASEARDIYPMRALLDPEALALAGPPGADRLAELRRLNREIASNRGQPHRILELDEDWHRLLLRGCPNRELLALIEHYIVRTRRYEVAYFRATRHVDIATDEHDRILDHLERDDLEGACLALRRNMQSAVEPILDWLTSRHETTRSSSGATPSSWSPARTSAAATPRTSPAG